MSLPLVLLLAFASAVLLTGVLRRYALARSVLDVPNERSSHQVPTPRGGGVAIVLAFLVSTAALAVLGLISVPAATALGGAGTLVACVGFLDDHRNVEIRWRLLSHFAAAGWGLWWLGGLPSLPIFGVVLHPGMAGNLLAVLALVWLLNLYNFMDGIDGIAGVEAVTASLGAVFVTWMTGASLGATVLPALLAVTALGFLVWNYPPAHIFMGDAGSGFLGITLGLLAVLAGRTTPELLWSWVILLGVFVVDATVTLLRRASRPRELHLAHRSHAYQHAAMRAGRHAPVTLSVGAINVLWLLPWATLVAMRLVDPGAALAIALLPLVLLAFRYGAGLENPRHDPASQRD